MSTELEKEIAGRLMHAGSGERRGEIVAYYMHTYGMSRGKVYTMARKGGYRSRRKPRADRGKIKCGLTPDDLKLVAGMQKCTKRRNKNMLMPTTVALELLNDTRKLDGKEELDISPSTVNRHLRIRGISRRQMLRNWTTDDHQTPAFCVSMTAEFVNEWHAFDITPCIQYYFKPKKGLAQHDMNLELYPGKLENFKKIGKHLHRYVLIDVKSQCYFFKYYYSAGENLADLLDFLFSAWAFKEKYPFCGVPFNLYADKGAAMKSQFLRSVADRLQINLDHHKKGNSRAKGIVEERMKYIQEHFECKTAFRPAMSLEEINQWAFEWCIKDNALSIHTRMKTTRLAKWTALIRPEHKRILDCTKETFMGLATSKPVPARISTYKTIRFNGQEYLISGPVNRGDEVMVDYDFIDKNNIRAWKVEMDTQNIIHLRATIIRRDAYGDREDAVKIGKEYKRHEDTPIQVAMKEMDGIDYSKVAAASFGHDLEKVPEKVGYIERQGTVIDVGIKNVDREIPCRDTEHRVLSSMDTEHRVPTETGGMKSEIITYSRHDVFREVRFRLKLERITPIQSQLIDECLGDRQAVEDTVIEEICQLLGKSEDRSQEAEVELRKVVLG